jgi:hypothetical protein
VQPIQHTDVSRESRNLFTATEVAAAIGADLETINKWLVSFASLPDQNNDQRDERQINREFLLSVHRYVRRSVARPQPRLGRGSPKQECKSVS